MTNCAYHPERDAVGACVNCGKLICEECKKTIGEKIYCNPCSKSVVENTSGQGRLATIPEEVRGWNWGALLLGVIWGIGNNVWIALLEFIPFLGFIIPFVLGQKGNEWAWRNKKWDSVEHFKRTQRTLTKWGVWLIVIIPILFFILAAVVIPNLGRFIG